MFVMHFVLAMAALVANSRANVRVLRTHIDIFTEKWNLVDESGSNMVIYQR